MSPVEVSKRVSHRGLEVTKVTSIRKRKQRGLNFLKFANYSIYSYSIVCFSAIFIFNCFLLFTVSVGLNQSNSFVKVFLLNLQIQRGIEEQRTKLA